MRHEIILRDAREVLAQMPEESVHCVITSPPYWGLRDFGEGMDCEFEDGWRGQYGLEPTPELYVEHTLEFLRAIWRVLRKDGTVWWNLGDNYASVSAREGTPRKRPDLPQPAGSWGAQDVTTHQRTAMGDIKPKDLVMIPFRVALAAQADGWWVRQVIIWEKPNPMPESVTDRCTVSHEYVWMFVKLGETQYWTHRDKDGVRIKPKPDYRWVNQVTEEEVAEEPEDWQQEIVCPKCQGKKTLTYTEMVMGAEMSWEDECDLCEGEGKIQLWKRINLWRGHDYYYDADAIREPHATADTDPRRRMTLEQYEAAKVGRYVKPGQNELAKGRMSDKKVGFQYLGNPAGRNKRSVWTIPTHPYPGPHYATFPPDLIEPMILAGTSPKVCAECGAPWERVTEISYTKEGAHAARIDVAGKVSNDRTGGDLEEGGFRPQEMKFGRANKVVETKGWRPTCSCNADTKPAVVLDPFCGTATVAEKCIEHHRDYVMIDIDPKSIELAKKRTEAVQMRLV